MSASKEYLWPCTELGLDKFDSGVIHCDPYVQGHSAIQWYSDNTQAPPDPQPPFDPFTNCPTTTPPPPRTGYVMYGCADVPFSLPAAAPPAGSIRIYGEYHLPWPLHSGIWIFRTNVTPTTSRTPPPDAVDPTYYYDVDCALGSSGSMTPQVDTALQGYGAQTTGDYVMNVYDVSLCACPQPKSFDKYLTFIFDPSEYNLQAVDIQMTGAFSSDFPPGFIA